MTWTGKKCPACKGIGERYHAGRDCDAACPDCGGTGEEFVHDPEDEKREAMRDKLRDQIANSGDC